MTTKDKILVLKDRVNELDYRLIVSRSKAHESMLVLIKQVSNMVKKIEKDIKERINESNT